MAFRNLPEGYETIGWISWPASGVPQCSRQHVIASREATKTLCGRSVGPSESCDDGEACDDHCKACEKIADKRQREEEKASKDVPCTVLREMYRY